MTSSTPSFLTTVGSDPDPQYSGVYAATVATTADPLGQGRVNLYIPQVLGTAVSNWAVPMQPGITPAVGTACLAVFLGGNLNLPYYFLGVTDNLIEAISSPGTVLNANPFFIGGVITPWTATGGTLTAVSPNPDTSPPYVNGVLWQAAGTGGGYITEVSSTFLATTGQPYSVQAWVYYPVGGSVNIGFGWTGQANTTASFTVPANTWTQISTVQTALASTGWPIVGPATSTTGEQFTAEAILVIGSIPGGIITPATITNTQLSPTVTARSLNGITTTISGTQPSVGSSVAGDLWFDSAAGYQLYQFQSGAWSLYQFGTGAIAAGSVTAALIAANTITAAQIAAGTITATQIAAGTINTAQLNAHAIDGMTITGSTVITDSASGGVFVYSGTPATGNLVVSMAAQANANDGFGNSYPAGFGVNPGLLNGTVSTTQQGTVLNVNPYFLNGDATGWTSLNSSAFSVTSTSLPAGSPYPYAAKFTSNGVGPGLVLQTDAVAFPVTGTSYLVSAWVYSPDTSIEIGCQWLANNQSSSAVTTTVASGSNGGTISGIASWAHPSAGVLDVASITGFPQAATVTVAASGATTATVTYSGTAAGQLTGCVYVSGSPSGTVSTGGAVALAPVTMTQTVTANTWTYVQAVVSPVMGAVWGIPVVGPVTPTSGHITYAEALTVTLQIPGAALVPGTVTTTEVADGTIQLGDLNTVDVTARGLGGITSTVGASAPDTSTSFAGDIWINSSNGYQVNQFDGTSWNAITFCAASTLQAGSITTGLIAAGAVSAGQIAANSITAAAIQAGAIDGFTINGVNINGNTISAADFIISATDGGLFVYSSGTTTVKTFSSTSTWKCPSGVITAQVECWGGGGGGGGHDTTSGTNGGGGGGGGGYATNPTLSVSAGTTYTVTVGGGGAAGGSNAAGATGGTSWFSTSSTVAAAGGVGGGFAGGSGAGGAGTHGSSFNTGGAGGAGANSGGSGGYQLFTSSGTFTPAAGVYSVSVDVTGGGGGGGASYVASGYGGSGGGGGGTAAHGSVAVTPLTGCTVTVGGGGAGGRADTETNGSVGTHSQFVGISQTITGNAGGGGLLQGYSAGGGGGSGTAVGGTIQTGGNGGTSNAFEGGFNCQGGGGGGSGGALGNGGNGAAGSKNNAGTGGAAGSGNGAKGGNGGFATGQTSGQPDIAYTPGGGGGGGGCSVNGNGYGAQGGRGQVYVSWSGVGQQGGGGGGNATASGTGAAGSVENGGGNGGDLAGAPGMGSGGEGYDAHLAAQAGGAGQVRLTYAPAGAATLLASFCGAATVDPVNGNTCPEGLTFFDTGNAANFTTFSGDTTDGHTTVSNYLEISDVSAPTAPAGTSSKLYSTAGNMYYIGGSAGDGNLYGIGTFVNYLTANATTCSTTAQTATGLSVPVSSGQKYWIEAEIYFSATSTGNDAYLSLAGPTTSAFNLLIKYEQLYEASFAQNMTATLVRVQTTMGTNTPCNSNPLWSGEGYWCSMQGYMTTSSSSNLVVNQAASVNSTTFTVQQGSKLMIWPVG